MPTRPDFTDLQIDRYRDTATIRSSYQRDHGLLVIPVMGPAGTAPVVARVHAPYGTRTTSFNYSKHGSPPLMPSLEDTSSGDVLLAADLSFPAPITDQSGTLIYGAEGELMFVQPLGGRAQGDSFVLDRHPFPTKVDILGAYPSPEMSFPSSIMFGEWNSGSVDTAKLTSSGLVR